jgi:hypothetical protein
MNYFSKKKQSFSSDGIDEDPKTQLFSQHLVIG